MRDESAPRADRRAAAIALLDRGYGKPSQEVQFVGDEDGGPVKVEHAATEAFMAEMDRIRRRLEATEMT
jgi:hypothetical protein